MAVQLVLRNGTQSENNAFTGAEAEVTVDTTNNSIRVHDGTTAGGTALITSTSSSTLSNKTLEDPTFTGQITGDLIPSADVTYDLGSATNRWNDLFLSGNTIDIGGATISVVGGSFEFKDSGGNDAEVSLAANNTDDLSEGSSNLYYTDARVRNAVSADGDLTYNSSTGTFSFTERTDAEVRGLLSTTGDLNYNITTGEFSVTTYKTSDFDTDFSNKDTSDLAEGSNLYYTDARVDAHLSGGSGIDFSNGTISHSDTSSVSSVSATSNTFIDAITFDTFGHVTAVSTSTAAPPNDATITVSAGTGLTGGGNFTTDQSGNETISLDIDTSTIATRSYVDTEVANLVDSSPSTLDTLNELAAALGDDPNFATTVANDIGDKADKTININAGSGLTGGGDLSSSRTISHADTSSVSDVSPSSNTFVDAITFDTFGHVQSVSTSTAAPPNDATITIAAGASLSGGGNFTVDQSTNNTITIDHGDTSTLSGTYGSTSNNTKINEITVDSNGHVTNVTTGVTGDILEVNAGNGLTGGGTTGSVTVSHADTSTQTSVDNSDGTVIQDVTLDEFGHVTNLNSTNLDSRYLVETSDSPPTNPVDGSLWWDSSFGQMFVYYDDGTSAQWIESSPSSHPLAYDEGTNTYTLDGNLSVNGDVNSTSDKNLKTNISTITSSVDKVSELRGVNFEWKDSGKKSLGVIAQEIEEVLPELVNETKEGNKTVQYGNMVGLLIEAVKELNEKIERLENK